MSESYEQATQRLMAENNTLRAEVSRLREALRELVEADKAFTPALIAGLKDIREAVKLDIVEEKRQSAIIKAEEVLK